jgi:predicted dehydrogenase
MTDRTAPPISRRGFLQAAGGTLAAASLAPAPAGAQVPALKLPEVPGRQIGFALVGLGSLAINQLMPAFAQSRLAKLVAFVSGRPDKAKHMAQLYGVDPKNIYGYENYERIADNPAIDVIYVVLPNSMHAEYTIRALKAGKHVLCEKPMANTPQECEQMIAAAKAANRKLMVGYRVRYEPFNQALTTYARETAEAGPTRLILADAGFNIGDPKQWRLRRPMAGGGSLMDIGIYALNAARYLSGEEPVAVNAMMHSTPDDPRFAEVEENIMFQLRFPSGLLANCGSSYGGGINRFRVIKPRGSAELDPASSYTGLRMRVWRGGAIEERTLPQRNHFALEMDHLAGCILNDTAPLTPGEEGLKDMRIITAIYEAARSGRTIALT